MLLLTIFSEAAASIVTQPFICGEELERLALEASRDCVRAAVDAAGIDLADAVSLEILNGGKFYFVADAVRTETGHACATSSVRAQRSAGAAPQEWALRIWDWQNLDCIQRHKGPLLVGDTIATGTTLAGILSVAVAEMEAHANVRDVVCLTVAGSSFCAQHPRLLELDERLARHGRHLVMVFANAQYDLHADGTHLQLTGRRVLYHARARALMEGMLGEYMAHMKCAVWDWSDRFLRIERHLRDISQHHENQTRVAPAWLTQGIAERVHYYSKNA